MDKELSDYLAIHSRKSKEYKDESATVLHYERDITIFRSSTVITELSWASSKVIIINEQHFDNF